MQPHLNTEKFCAALPVITDFELVTRAESFGVLPADWHVAFCDVRNSTAAVAAGNYCNVNSIGAAAITAVINAADGVDIPFSFEGDGAVRAAAPAGSHARGAGQDPRGRARCLRPGSSHRYSPGHRDSAGLQLARVI